MARPFHARRLGATLLALAALVIVAVPAATAVEGGKVPEAFLEHLSQSVSANYWARHPAEAPARFAQLSGSQKQPPARNVNSCTSNANKDVFNCDIFGLPQNEESVGVCASNDNFVLEGTNDYRGLIDPEGNFTGWHWSIDGGHSVQNEGLLPPVTVRHLPTGLRDLPSGGDPVDFLPAGCDKVYAASLAYSPTNPF